MCLADVDVITNIAKAPISFYVVVGVITNYAVVGVITNNIYAHLFLCASSLNHLTSYLKSNSLRTKVLLSANRALLGAITPPLRGITVDYNPEQFILRAYFDLNASETDLELIDIALTEMIADLHPEIAQFIYEPIELPFPEKMEPLKDWVYRRYEQKN